MVIDDYAYNNKLSKVNPNKKFAIGIFFLCLSLVNPYKYISWCKWSAKIKSIYFYRYLFSTWSPPQK